MLVKNIFLSIFFVVCAILSNNFCQNSWDCLLPTASLSKQKEQKCVKKCIMSIRGLRFMYSLDLQISVDTHEVHKDMIDNKLPCLSENAYLMIVSLNI